MLRLTFSRIGVTATQRPALAVMAIRTHLQAPPKRPRSSFLIFQNTGTKGTSGSAKQQTISASEEWRTMSDSQRKEWEELAKEERASYHREKEEYMKKCPPRPKLITSPLHVFMSKTVKAGTPFEEASKMMKDIPAADLLEYEKEMHARNKEIQVELDAWLLEHSDAVQKIDAIRASPPTLNRFRSFIKYAQEPAARSKYFEPLKEYRRRLKAQSKDDVTDISSGDKRKLTTLKAEDLPKDLLEEMKRNHVIYVAATKRRHNLDAIRTGCVHAM